MKSGMTLFAVMSLIAFQAEAGFVCQNDDETVKVSTTAVPLVWAVEYNGDDFKAVSGFTKRVDAQVSTDDLKGSGYIEVTLTNRDNNARQTKVINGKKLRLQRNSATKVPNDRRLPTERLDMGSIFTVDNEKTVVTCEDLED